MTAAASLPMKHRIVLAHASDTKALAEVAARRLTGLNIEVERRSLDTMNGAMRGVDRLILLWSRGAAGAETLLRRADLADRVCVVRLAVSPTPPRLKAPVIALPRANDSDDAWRALAGIAPARTAPTRVVQRAQPTEHLGVRWHALLVVTLMSAITATAAYVASARFADAIDALLRTQ